MWQALRDGTLSTIATDELCTDLATKVRGQTIHDVTGGHAGIEVRLAVAYTEAVARRNMPLAHFVERYLRERRSDPRDVPHERGHRRQQRRGPGGL